MNGPTIKLTIAVMTFRRNFLLSRLLPILTSQAVDCSDTTTAVDVLVVDNNPDAAALEVVVDGRAALQERAMVPIRYEHEPTPGIAAARNRAMDASPHHELLVFIDDDEVPSPGWLAALMATFTATPSAAGVVGPVVSSLEGEPDPYVVAGGFFERPLLATGTTRAVAATNNLLLDLRRVRSAGVRFDVAMGLTGGSDTLFTSQLTGSGLPLVWCAEASVTDLVPAHRATRRWVLRRAFRYGVTWSSVRRRLAGSQASRLSRSARWFVEGVGRALVGLSRAFVGLITHDLRRRARGELTLARGLGMAWGALGGAYLEYRR